jgi:CheY-like chemotaxis protein/anti-sigma regulatory factor (Ser/Thr protein kinase)
MILIFRDTTERDVIFKLEDNNKFKDRLLASVSHELRTPLNGNINMIEAAIDNDDVPESVKQNLLLPALRTGKFLLNIINDILDFSQMQVNKLQLSFSAGDLRKTITDCVQLIELQAKKKGLHVTMDIGHGLPSDGEFSTDFSRLAQILLNLLSNAVKFTYTGNVTLKAEVMSGKNHIKISVIDTGIGISEENQKLLFEPFTRFDIGEETRTKLNQNGVGLGLSIAHALASQLSVNLNDDIRGIKIQSIIGEGSKFSLIVENHLIIPFKSSLLHNNRKPHSSCSLSGSDLDSPSCDKIYEFTTEALESPSSRGPIKMNSDVSLLHRTNPILNSKLMMTTDNIPLCTCNIILEVDDDSFNVMAMEVILKKLNLRCDIAFNGQQAIDKILKRTNSPCSAECKNYAVVLMDFTMPIMDGYETTRRLKQCMKEGVIPEIPIVGCTALTSRDQVDEGIECGMIECINKPVSKQVLSVTLSKYIKI